MRACVHACVLPGFDICREQCFSTTPAVRAAAWWPLLSFCVHAGEEALYEEDLQEDEVALELAPVTAQLAYVASMCVRQCTAAAGVPAAIDAIDAEEHWCKGFPCCLPLLGVLSPRAPFVDPHPSRAPVVAGWGVRRRPLPAMKACWDWSWTMQPPPQVPPPPPPLCAGRTRRSAGVLPPPTLSFSPCRPAPPRPSAAPPSPALQWPPTTCLPRCCGRRRPPPAARWLGTG